MFGFHACSIHDHNTYEVLQQIAQKGRAEKKELQTLTGFSWGGISNSIAKLMDWGLIVQQKQNKKVVSGRIPSHFQINTEQNLCVGIDITLGRITGILSALDGTILFNRTDRIADNKSETVMHCLTGMLDAIFLLPYASQVRAIGIALPGSTIEYLGKHTLEHPFHGDFPADLAQMMERRYGVMTEIFHDPDCLLMAELHAMQAEERCSNLVVLRWTHGIGMSILINNKIYHGANGIAGEIGHFVVDPEGALCSCGKRGCLEAYASVQTILDKVATAVNEGKTEWFLPEQAIGIEAVFDAFAHEDAAVTAIVQQALEKMALVIANVVIMFDPQVLMISGEFTRFPRARFNAFKRMIMRYVVIGSNIDIRQSELEEYAPALGAALLMRDRVYCELFDGNDGGTK